MMIDLAALSKSFAGTPALTDASLAVAAGELVCLLGPSGCGKSTLLRLISGLAQADRGTIRLDGQDMTTAPANRRPTAMVFQSHALWPHMSVARNVGFGLRVRGLPRDQIAAKVAGALDLVGLRGFDRRLPSELSGGQAQRVALARCLVVEPKVLLMDEPFSALDAHLRKSLREELKALQRRLGLTTVFVTHDQEEAMELADRIIVMRAGRIEQDATPGGLYAQPKTLSVAQFIGQMNVTLATARDGAIPWMGALVDMPVDGDLALACRPEDLIQTPDGVAVRVQSVTDLGPLLRVALLSAGGETLTWLTPREAAPAPGQVVTLWPRRLLVFRDGSLLDAITPQRLPVLHPEALA
jgi:putative spermidine/putrescine transport system ATP-binding protein